MRNQPSNGNQLNWASRLLQRVLLRIRPQYVAAALKRILRVARITYATPEGTFSLDPISILGSKLTRGREHEPEMIRTLKNFLPSGSVFVDLGANEGYFSVIAGRLVGPSGRVIAIEPQPRLAPVFQKNLALNGVESVVAVYGLAIGNSEGKVMLHLTSDLNSGASGILRPTKYSLPTIEVSMMRLGVLLDQAAVPRVDLLKVDIEGYEYEAILGSPELFSEHRVRAIALELHPASLKKRGIALEAIPQFLEGCGYQIDRRFENLVYRIPE